MKRSGVGPRRSSSFILPRATPTLLNYFLFATAEPKKYKYEAKENVIREKES
jgi:hypothetical protein